MMEYLIIFWTGAWILIRIVGAFLLFAFGLVLLGDLFRHVERRWPKGVDRAEQTVRVVFWIAITIAVCFVVGLCATGQPK